MRKEFVDQISHFEKRRELFSKDYRIISFITNNSSDFDSLISDVKRSTQIRTALFDMRYFSPSRDIYNSIVNEGLFKYIQSDRLKVLLNKLYATDYEYMVGNIMSEGIYLDDIIFYLTENHPKLYRRLASREEISLDELTLIVNYIRSDEVLTSKLQFKENKMRIKLYLLDDYLKHCQEIETLISELGF